MNYLNIDDHIYYEIKMHSLNNQSECKCNECKQKFLCLKCERYGHTLEYCRTRQCEICHKFGHLSKNCRRHYKCERCFNYGHDERNCKTIICQRCNRNGHISMECRRNTYMCTQCGNDIMCLDNHRCNRDDIGIWKYLKWRKEDQKRFYFKYQWIIRFRDRLINYRLMKSDYLHHKKRLRDKKLIYEKNKKNMLKELKSLNWVNVHSSDKVSAMIKEHNDKVILPLSREIRNKTNKIAFNLEMIKTLEKHVEKDSKFIKTANTRIKNMTSYSNKFIQQFEENEKKYGHRAFPGASGPAIGRANAERKRGLGPTRVCNICYEQIPNKIAVTKCGHIFCVDCILKSLKYRKKCPICRISLYFEDYAVIDYNYDISSKVGSYYEIKKNYIKI